MKSPITSFKQISVYSTLIFSLVLLIGCTCNGNKQGQDTKDSLERLKADSLTTEGRMASRQFVFDSLTTDWLSSAMGGRKVDTAAFSNGHAPGHHLDSTVADGADAAVGAFTDSSAFQADASFYKDYASVLRWSPDSSYLLDFGSYGNIPVKGKEGRSSLEGGEPDTKIMIAIPGEHKQWLVMFAGPGTSILDAKWKNDHQFMLLYAFQQEHNEADTTLIMGDMKTRSLHWYELNNQ